MNFEPFPGEVAGFVLWLLCELPTLRVLGVCYSDAPMQKQVQL
jgi:hypothetical protein